MTDEQKKQCIPTVHKLIKLANCARMQGVLALEDEALNDESILLRTGVSLIVDGNDPVLVEKILQNMIDADNYEGAELLNRRLIAEGVLSIQRGDNPRIIAGILSAMLGEKYYQEVVDSCFPDGGNPYSMPIFREPRAALPECVAFEERLMKLNRGDMFRLFGKLDVYAWALASAGCSTQFVYQLANSVSQKVYMEFCRDLGMVMEHPKSMILDAQAAVIRQLDELVGYGEIIEWDKMEGMEGTFTFER